MNIEQYVGIMRPHSKRYGIALDVGQLVATDGHRMLIIDDPDIVTENLRVIIPGESEFPRNWREVRRIPTDGHHVYVRQPELHRQVVAMDKVAKAARHEQVASFRSVRDAPDSSRKDAEAARANMRDLPPPYFRMRLSDYYVFLSDATERSEMTVPVVGGRIAVDDQTYRLSLNSKYVLEGCRVFRKLKCHDVCIDFGADDLQPMHIRGTAESGSKLHYIVMPMRP